MHGLNSTLPDAGLNSTTLGVGFKAEQHCLPIWVELHYHCLLTFKQFKQHNIAYCGFKQHSISKLPCFTALPVAGLNIAALLAMGLSSTTLSVVDLTFSVMGLTSIALPSLGLNSTVLLAASFNSKTLLVTALNSPTLPALGSALFVFNMFKGNKNTF